MSVYKNSRDKWCYDIEWEHADGTIQRIRKTSPVQTRVGAEREERKVRDSLSNGTYGQRSKEDIPTVAEYKQVFMDWCKAERQKPNTEEAKEGAFKRYVLPLFGAKRLDRFGIDDQKRLRGLMAELAPGTYNIAASAINQLLKIAKANNVFSTKAFQFQRLKRPETKMAFYDLDQKERLVISAAHVDVFAECIILLGIDAGLRRCEMFMLRFFNINFESGFMVVERAESVIRKVRKEHSTKSNNSRDIPLTPRLADVLQRIKKLTNAGAAFGGRVLIVNGRLPTKQSVTGVIAKVQKLAGVAGLGGSHILRHTFCSHLAMLGVPVLTIKELAGHKRIETTLKYMHLAPGEKARGIALLAQSSNGNPMATAAE